jgi:cardiolipin synthase
VIGTDGSASGARPADAAPRPRPDWLTVPNLVSLARLLLVPVFAVLALRGHDAAALVVLVVAGASDWLDGRLARALGQQSRLGELLDPSADRLFILVTLLVLASRDVVPWWLVGVIVGRDVLLTVVLAVLLARRIGPLPVHFVGKAGTFALLYAFPLLLLARWPGWVGTAADVAGWATALWGVALYWLAGAVYLRQAAQELARARAERRAVAAAGGGRP